jgi:hypothetical protein
MVAEGMGEDGGTMAVCVPKKDPTIVPTTEVITASGSSVGVPSPVQAVKMDATMSMIKMRVMYFFMYFSVMRKPSLNQEVLY